MGKYVRLYGGLVRIITDTSATVVSGEIVLELARGRDADPRRVAGAWFLEAPIWTDDRGWPGACCFHDQRLVLGGSPSDPLGFAGSRHQRLSRTSRSAPTTTTPGSTRWSAPTTSSARSSRSGPSSRSPRAREHVISGGDNSTPHITPASVHAQTDTAYGCAYDPAPLHVGNAVIFVQRGGTRIRELTYDFGTDARVAPDLGMLAEHLLRAGIVQLARQTSPDSIVFALRSDGALLCCAYERPEQVVAWSRWITGEAQDLTDGFYESRRGHPQRLRYRRRGLGDGAAPVSRDRARGHADARRAHRDHHVHGIGARSSSRATWATSSPASRPTAAPSSTP